MFINYLLLFLFQSFLALAIPYKSQRDLKSQYLVSNIPGLYKNIPKEEIPLMFSGQLELFRENNTHYFFWKYSDIKKIPENSNRTIFWLNGGPGCSSMDGALMEAGPFRISEDKEVIYNNGSWHKLSDIVFVDQPAGTGFSFSDDYDHDLGQIVVEFLRFLDKYYEVFPEDIANEIYFAGESYAGQYIPYIADGILRRNKNLKEGGKPYNLKGLLIGNGWISPNEQSLSYLPYSVQAGIIKSDNPNFSKILHQHEECQKIVNKIDSVWKENTLHDFEVSSDTCETVLQYILEATRDTSSGKDKECFNMYDYTLKDSYPSCGSNWPPDLAYVTPFLRENIVMSDLNLIHFTDWHECSGSVGRNFRAKNSLPSVHLLPGILAEIPIVLFNGNRDIICNYLGTENFIKKLEWNGHTGYSEDTDKVDWIYDNETVGYIKTERNLTFVNVFDSSHMVPFDKPEVSRALIDLITGNFDEKEVEQKSDSKKRAFITYPLGVRMNNLEKGDDKESKQGQIDPQFETISSIASDRASPTSTLFSVSSATDYPMTSIAATSSSVPSTSSTQAKDDSSHTANRITRLIQLLVIIVLIWGIYVLFSSYKSRPSSIIKSGPSSGKKKNVQWADQLRSFQEDDQQNRQSKQGFFSKTFNKLKGGDSRGSYAPAPDKYYDDIELGEGFTENDNSLDNFTIDSDNEDHDVEEHHYTAQELNRNST